MNGQIVLWVRENSPDNNTNVNNTVHDDFLLKFIGFN